MIAYNISFDTHCSLAWARANLKETDYRIPPYIENPTYCFVRPHIHMGVMAELERDLLAARAQAKKDLRAEQDPKKKKVLDARQLAIKLCANSGYGFFKAHYISNKDCMEAITAWGRYMIELTEKVICEHFTPEHTRHIHKIAPTAMNFVYAYMNHHTASYSAQDLSNVDWWRVEMMIHFKRDIVDERAELIYGDTDSVMVAFGPMSNERAWYLGERASHIATCYFEQPNELECEAVKQPAIFIKKKGYIVRERTWAKDKGKIKVQGETAKRRDNFLLVANLQKQCAEMLMRDASDGGPDVIGAIELVHRTCRRLLMCKVDISELVISQTFSKTLEQYEEGGAKPAHVELWKKKRARAHITGEYLESTGDRVPYVVMPAVNNGSLAAKKWERVEDPEYCMRNGLYPDPQWYLEQLKKPLMRLFSPVFTGDITEWVTPAIRRNPLIAPIFEDMQSTLQGKKVRTQEHITTSIASSKKKLSKMMAHRILFEGSHTRIRVHRSIRMEAKQQKKNKTMGSLAAFVSKGLRCLKCMNVIKPERKNTYMSKAVCRSCMPYHGIIYQEELRKFSLKQRLFNEAWTRCQRCQGSAFKEVICGNRDCDNFYRRIALQVDIEDLAEKLERFNE